MWRGRAGPVEGVHRAHGDRPPVQPDAADLIAAPGSGVDVAEFGPRRRPSAGTWRRWRADRALGQIRRAQMLAATDQGNARLAEIADELAEAARESVLAPLIAAENADQVWEALDLARKRAIIKTLMTITLRSPGKGARRGFDPATVQIAWHQNGQEEDEAPQRQAG